MVCLQVTLKMATKDNLQRLNNRATEAENQISSLKSQLESVKQAGIKSSYFSPHPHLRNKFKRSFPG